MLEMTRCDPGHRLDVRYAHYCLEMEIMRMTLRIVGASKGNGEIESFAISQSRPDNWEERVVKLIPAEAMTLYGTGYVLLQNGNEFSQSLASALLVACILITGMIRFRATKDPQTGRPQWMAILIVIVSFVLWALSVTPGLYQTPEGLDQILPLLTLAWVALAPSLYTGSSS